jgi:hypothetical protein
LWQRFETLAADNPPAGRLWWQLCGGDDQEPTFDIVLAVLSEIQLRLPGVTVFASAQPSYSEGHVCRMAGAQGPALMSDLVEALVSGGGVNPGPTMGPLTKDQTVDGCHANDAGRALMGAQLADFIGQIGSQDPGLSG